MPRKEITTTLVDIDGVEHEYQALLYPADHAVRLFAVLAQALEGVTEDTDVMGYMAALAKVVARGGSDLLDRVFLGCRRSVEVDGKKRWQSLGSETWRNEAYQGNLGEMVRALKWILTENYGPFFREITAAVSEM